MKSFIKKYLIAIVGLLLIASPAFAYIYNPTGSGGGGGTVTNVTASLPLTSSGGVTPNIAIIQPAPGYLWYSSLNTGDLVGDVNHAITAITGSTRLIANSGANFGRFFVDPNSVSIVQAGAGYTYTASIEPTGFKLDFGGIIGSYTFPIGNAAGQLNNDGAGNLTWSGAGGTNLIGRTSGIVSAPAPGGTFEAWFGQLAGNGASTVATTFIGYGAGNGAATADLSSMVGEGAGSGAIDAHGATFFGAAAGLNAANAFNTTAMGLMAGQNATNASESIFFGGNAGNGATDSLQATFIGASAGAGATSAARSTFIGFLAGNNDTVNNIASGHSILIGDNSNTAGFQNSVGIGSGVNNTAANQFLADSPIGPFTDITFNSTTGVFQAGDINGVGDNTVFKVQDNFEQIVAQANQSFRVIRAAGGAAAIYAIPSQFKVTLGDVDSAINHTRFVVDDSNTLIQGYTNQFEIRNLTGAGRFLNINPNANVYSIGDEDATNNGSSIEINDNTQKYTLNKLGGSGDAIVTTDNSGVLGKTALSSLANTYTPTLTGVTNVTASTPHVSSYSRVGSVVTVFGSLDVTTTLAVATEIDISLPIASNLGATTDANGLGSATSAIATNIYGDGDATNDRVRLKFIGLSVGGAGTIFFSFQYNVV